MYRVFIVLYLLIMKNKLILVSTIMVTCILLRYSQQVKNIQETQSFIHFKNISWRSGQL
jgi:hypothetical protein